MTQAVTKAELRRRLRAARSGLVVSEWARASQAIVARLERHPALLAATHVALFWPMILRREVDLRALDPGLRRRGVRVSYPYYSVGALGFRQCDDPAQLIDNPWGFREPGPECSEVVLGVSSVIVLPALALTRAGQRLGYGAGFYDRVLDRYSSASTIGTCFDFELLDQLPREAHDRPVDWVVTDARTLAASSTARSWPASVPPPSEGEC